MAVSGYTSKTREDMGYTKAGSSKTAAAESSPVTKTDTAKKEDSKTAASSSSKVSDTSATTSAARRKKIYEAKMKKGKAKRSGILDKKQGYQK